MLKKVNKNPTDKIKKVMLGKCHKVLNHENYYFDNLGILQFEHNFFHKINIVIYSDITLLSNPDF